MWAWIFFAHSVTNPIMYWLPLINIAGFLLVVYIDYDTKKTIEEVDNLEKMKYEYKKV